MPNFVRIILDGTEMSVPAGISVAAAVFRCRQRTGMHPDGSPMSPYCFSGSCFGCLMEINGEPNIRSCRVTVQNGMIVKTYSVTPQ
ncbi:MAG: (2Fe-2S)-binding protein [Desulfovibrionaceae bacterium]|nr:(2Fe-2S)-binding protein [Desulfovibrionaceae bacterium]